MSFSTLKEAPPPTAVFTQLLFGKQVAYSLLPSHASAWPTYKSSHFFSVDELAEKVGEP
jgi:hypothetical protein